MSKKVAKGKKKVEAVTAKPAAGYRVPHPIKAARLLYSSPSFILRGPIYVMFFALFSGLAYSFVARSDVRVTAPLVLERKAVTVQAIGGGLVESLFVQRNATVSAGDRLARIQERIRAAMTPEQEALLANIRELEDRKAKLVQDYTFQIRQLELERSNLGQAKARERSEIEDSISQLAIQLQQARRELDGYRDDLRTARRELEVRSSLYRTRDIPRAEFEAAQSRVTDLERGVQNAGGTVESAEQSLATAQRRLETLDERYSGEAIANSIKHLEETRDSERVRIEDQIDELKARLTVAQNLVPGVRYEGDIAEYTSLVDGIVTDVHVERGEIINPGSDVVTIVRNSAPLQARVLVSNKDIGALKLGQSVQIKYFAYPYQDYGIQRGVIDSISTAPSTVPGEQGRYVINVVLERESITSQTGVDRQLKIGLEGVAEIKTGERRFIEILFAPAARFFTEQDSEET